MCAVTILAELGDAGGLATPVMRSVTAAWTSPQSNPINTGRLGTSPAKGHRRCAGRCTKPPNRHGIHAAPTATTTSKSPSGSAVTARASRSRANSSNAATTPSEPSAKTPWRPHEASSCAPAFNHTDSPRPAPRMPLPTPRGRPRKHERPQRCPSGITPSTIMSPTRSSTRAADRSKAGRSRAQHPPHRTRQRTPPAGTAAVTPTTRALDGWRWTSKGKRAGVAARAPATRPSQQRRSIRHVLALRDNQGHACCKGCGVA
jgi:hypothetical protein